jgi:hypothetical protein
MKSAELAGMRLLKSVPGYRLIGKRSNKDIRQESRMSFFKTKIKEY